MAIYNFEVKVGKNSASHLGYILRDDSLVDSIDVNKIKKSKNINHTNYIKRENRYSKYDDLVFSKSGNMPSWAKTEQEFWNASDQFERKNGRTYREFEVSLPRELSNEQNIELINKFIENVIGNRYAYTYAFHNKMASDGKLNPHFHLMFTERIHDGIDRPKEQFFRRYNPKNPEKGGARKDRFLNSRSFIYQVRKEWTNTANDFLAEKGLHIRIDDRSYKERNIDLISQNWDKYYLKDEKVELKNSFDTKNDLAIKKKINGQRIINNPEIALDALTSKQSMFTKEELENFLISHTDSEEQFVNAYNAVLNSEQFKQEENGFYTKLDLFMVEYSLVNQIRMINEIKIEELTKSELEINQKISNSKTFNSEQKSSYDLMVSNEHMVSINGAAGTGKSYMLSGVSDAFKERGYKVYGVALQSVIAENLRQDLSVESYTIAKFLNLYDKGEIKFDKKTVILLDEAGMVGSRNMERLVSISIENGTKFRMVGDSYQLSSVAAGDAFRKIQTYLNKNKQDGLRYILRQKAEVMRDASNLASTHQIDKALDIYQELGRINEHKTQKEAIINTVSEWYLDESGKKIMIAYRNKDVEIMNLYARKLLRYDGKIGDENYKLTIEDRDGELKNISISEGEKIIFKKNDYALGVMNGSIGVVEAVNSNEKKQVESMIIRLNDKDKITINVKDYNKFAYAYASTIHMSQGITVDNSYLLISKGMRANLAYVGLTRHKKNINIHYSEEDFEKGYNSLKNQLNVQDKKLFVGDKNLEIKIKEVKQNHLQNHREKLSERIKINDSSTQNKIFKEVLSLSEMKFDQVNPNVLSKPSKEILELYQNQKRINNKGLKIYRIGKVNIGVGDYITLEKDYIEKNKGILNKKIKIEAGAMLRVKDIQREKLENYLILEYKKIGIKREIKINPEFTNYKVSNMYKKLYQDGLFFLKLTDKRLFEFFL